VNSDTLQALLVLSAFTTDFVAVLVLCESCWANDLSSDLLMGPSQLTMFTAASHTKQLQDGRVHFIAQRKYLACK
jgi:hypothetical protein